MTTLSNLLQKGQARLSEHHIETPDIDAQVLLEYCFKLSKTEVLTRLRTPIQNNAKCTQYLRYIDKRCTGTPLAYITGTIPFRNSHYHVKKGVLIPRSETELLVEHTIQHIHKKFGPNPNISILELGLGTGIISIELAKAFPTITIHGWDISKRAIQNTQLNIEQQQIKNLNMYHKDFFKDLVRIAYIMHQKPCIIISNPPYIDTNELDTLDVRHHEPKRALDGGKKGLKIYKRLAKELSPNPFTLCCEIGYNQKPELLTLLEQYHFDNIQFFNDYQSHPRVCICSNKIL